MALQQRSQSSRRDTADFPLILALEAGDTQDNCKYLGHWLRWEFWMQYFILGPARIIDLFGRPLARWAA